MTYSKERDEFIAVCQRNGIDVTTSRKLLSLSKSHKRIQVAICNGPGRCVNYLTQVDEVYRKHEEICAIDEARVEKRIKEIADRINLKIDCGGDPRGYTVKIHFPDGSYNTWGGVESGYGIPQRN
jgi:hypothetical protein